MSILEDTIRWAAEHGYQVPGFQADGRSTIQATCDEIMKASQALEQQVGGLVQLNLARLLTQTDITRYDNARRTLYQAQFDLYRQLNSSALLREFRNYGLSPVIPMPTLAPPIQLFIGANPQLAGLGNPAAGVVAAPVAAGVWVGAVIAAVGVAIVLGIAVTAIASAFEAFVNSQSHRADMDARMQLYQACMADSGGTAEVCMRVARGIIEPPPPDALTPGWLKNLKSASKVVIPLTIVAGVGYGVVKYYSARTVARSLGFRGLGSTSGPRRLASLDDPHPSRYFLEIPR